MSGWLYLGCAVLVLTVVLLLGSRFVRRDDARLRVADPKKWSVGWMPGLTDELALRRARRELERRGHQSSGEAS